MGAQKAQRAVGGKMARILDAASAPRPRSNFTPLLAMQLWNFASDSPTSVRQNNLASRRRRCRRRRCRRRVPLPAAARRCSRRLPCADGAQVVFLRLPAGIATNIITYVTSQLGMSNASAASAVNIWSGTCYFSVSHGACMGPAGCSEGACWS